MDRKEGEREIFPDSVLHLPFSYRDIKTLVLSLTSNIPEVQLGKNSWDQILFYNIHILPKRCVGLIYSIILFSMQQQSLCCIPSCTDQ